MYVRCTEGTESETSEALKTAVNLGGPQEITTDIKSEALELAAQSDRQLQMIVISMGLLAIIVGGLLSLATGLEILFKIDKLINPSIPP